MPRHEQAWLAGESKPRFKNAQNARDFFMAPNAGIKPARPINCPLVAVTMRARLE